MKDETRPIQFVRDQLRQALQALYLNHLSEEFEPLIFKLVEADNKIVELIRISESDKPNMLGIECIIFKPSGTYYTDEVIMIPEDTESWNIPEQVLKNARIKDAIYYFRLGNDVPHVVIVPPVATTIEQTIDASETKEQQILNTPVWVSKGGERIPIKLLNEKHLINIIKMLLGKSRGRKSEDERDAVLASCQAQGDMASYYLERDATILSDMTLHEYASEHVHIYPYLIKEAESRGLIKVNECSFDWVRLIRS
ncbi:hypothetical protein KAT92_06360 [Candidatus Babeliales bacterium]|nr:hypothetical protein [Candidatus Babeliales bacterium]